MITKEQIADMLDGREYLEEVTPEVKVILNLQKNLVVVFGASDDLMEFRGAIDDEVSIWGGGLVPIDKNGVVENMCDDSRCPYFAEKIKNTKKIKAIWCNARFDYSWAYETDIPHSTFNIFEDGECYCRGIVFNLLDL